MTRSFNNLTLIVILKKMNEMNKIDDSSKPIKNFQSSKYQKFG